MISNQTAVRNKGNNIIYLVSTILNSKKITDGSMEAKTEFETIVFLATAPNKRKPQIVFHSMVGSGISLEQLHNEVVDIVSNEDFEKITTEDGIKNILPSKKHLIASVRPIFSIIGMYKCLHVFIYI